MDDFKNVIPFKKEINSPDSNISGVSWNNETQRGAILGILTNKLIFNKENFEMTIPMFLLLDAKQILHGGYSNKKTKLLWIH